MNTQKNDDLRFSSLKLNVSLVPADFIGAIFTHGPKVEIFLEPREGAFLSPSKICENSNFSRETQIFTNFAG